MEQTYFLMFFLTSLCILLQFFSIPYQSKMSNTLEVICFFENSPRLREQEQKVLTKKSYFIKVAVLKGKLFDYLYRILRHLQHILYILIFY